MSSTVRYPAQVQSNTGFFRALAATTEYVPSNGSTFRAVMTSTEFTAATTTATGGATTLYKDLGKTITVVSPTTGQHLSKFRLVQEMDGAADEGVPPTDPTYICTWSADSISPSVAGTYLVTVARIG